MIKDLTGIAKPCPMCGSKRIYIPYPTIGGSKRIYIPYPTIDRIYTMYIQCADCGLNGYKNFLKNVDIDDAMGRVINYWNTRAESEVQENDT